MTDFSLNLVLHQPLEEKEPAEPVLTLTGQRMPLKKIMNIPPMLCRPLYPKEKECRLNTALCTWPHDHSHLYYTDGISETCTRTDASILQARKDIDHQEKRNQIHFDEHQFIYRSSICKLSEQIQNAIFFSPVPLPIRGRSGQLATSEIWRGLFLHDDRDLLYKDGGRTAFLFRRSCTGCLRLLHGLSGNSRSTEYVIAQSLQSAGFQCRSLLFPAFAAIL